VNAGVATTCTPLEFAHAAVRREWKPIVLHHVRNGACTCGGGSECLSPGKHPVSGGWQKRPMPSGADVQALFEERPHANVGIQTGSVSGNLVVIDEDRLGALDELAARLSFTWADTFTVRTGKGGIHKYYEAPAGITVKNSASKLHPGVDVRGEGGYVVGPGSVSGYGPYTVVSDLPVAPLPPELVKLLRTREHERPELRTTTPGGPVAENQRRFVASGVAAELARLDELKRLMTPNGVGYTGPGWESTLFEVSCNVVELANAGAGYTLEQARTDVLARMPTDAGFGTNNVLGKFKHAVSYVDGKARELPAPIDGDPLGDGFPVRLSAAHGAAGGRVLATAEHGGAEQPATERQGRAKGQGPEGFPDPGDPMGVAEQLAGAWRHDGAYTIIHWRGDFFRWAGAHWAELSGDEMRALIYPRLHRGYFLAKGEDGEPESHMWKPTRRKVADVLEALAVVVRLDPNIAPPGWTDGRDSGAVVPFENGILDLRTRTFAELDPRLFTLWSLPFEYDPNAPQPTRWLAFLEQVFGQEPGAVDLLQEWFGYVISGQLSQQKMLLVIGPTRSGKGTVSRTLAQLVGERNVAWPSLSGLTSSFGLQPLIGKPLGVIADARMAGDRTRQHVVESLLNISGEDSMTLDRKYRDPWTGTLPTRLMMLSNEVPAFSDASGTIAQRFIVLRMKRSFLGQEDLKLGEALRAELPGILLWALQGLDRLNAARRFTGTESTAETVEAMAHGASPVRAFVDEQCVTGSVDLEVGKEDLWKAWRQWADDNNERPGGKEDFFRRLRSNVADLEDIRPRTTEGARIRKLAGIALRPKCATIGCSVRADDDLAPSGWQCTDHRMRAA
jgi:putative DNA primase/helicase